MLRFLPYVVEQMDDDSIASSESGMLKSGNELSDQPSRRFRIKVAGWAVCVDIQRCPVLALDLAVKGEGDEIAATQARHDADYNCSAVQGRFFDRPSFLLALGRTSSIYLHLTCTKPASQSEVRSTRHAVLVCQRWMERQMSPKPRPGWT